MLQYFEDEDKEDLFEGFVQLVIKLDKFTTTLAKHHDLSLAKIAMVAFHDFCVGHPDSIQASKQPDPKFIVIFCPIL